MQILVELEGLTIMMTLSNGNISRVTGLLRGIHRSSVNSPNKRPVTRSFGVFFDLRLNQRLSKQSCGWWFETRSDSLWRQYNANYWSHENRKLKSALPGYFWITRSETMHEVTNWFIDDMWWIAVSNLSQKSIYLWWNKWSLIIYY